MASFVNQRDLEDRIGVRKVVELFDDDGDGDIESASDQQGLRTTLEDANDAVTSILAKAFPDEASLNQLSEDRQVRRLASAVAAQHSGWRRLEFLNPQTGKGPYDAIGADARTTLKEIASAELRSRKERTTENSAGTNPLTEAPTSTSVPAFTFARDAGRNDPVGPGGF